MNEFYDAVENADRARMAMRIMREEHARKTVVLASTCKRRRRRRLRRQINRAHRQFLTSLESRTHWRYVKRSLTRSVITRFGRAAFVAALSRGDTRS